MMRSGSLWIGVVALALWSCSPETVGSTPVNLQESAAAEWRFEGLSAHDESPFQFSEAVAAFYSERRDRPFWVEHGRLNRDGIRLLQVLINSHEQGIDLPDLNLSVASGALQRISAEETGIYDHRLTELFLRYARAVRVGRMTPADAGMAWAIERPPFDAAQVLNRLQQGDAGAVLREQPPLDWNYRQLVTVLARYRDIVAAGGWSAIPAGPVLESGQTGNRVFLLRHRLAREGYLKGDAQGGFFDAPLQQAVQAFQERHGLMVDGRAGPETLAALNVPAEGRVAQIQMNMERWRWMPRELPERRVEVNVAAAELTVFDYDRPVLSMRTIVGSARHRTPMLQSAIRAVIVNPVWNVPVSITVNEIQPRLRREPDYLSRQDIRILDRAYDPYGSQIDWKNLPRGTRFRLQQQPGPLNALGRLKFDIPNRFDVYLHDTPAKTLFDRSKRALSHGCIRLQQPDRLAAYLLGGLDERLNPEPEDRETLRIPLQQPMPVYLLYWTAFVTPDGQTHFREDIYSHDARMRAVLPGGAKRQEMSRLDAGGCKINQG